MLYLPLSCYQGRIRPPCWWHAHEGLSVWMQWAVFEWRLALPLTNPGISHSASHTSLLTCGKRIMATPTSVGRKETKRGKNACESLWPRPPMGEALSKGQSQRLSCRWNVVSAWEVHGVIGRQERGGASRWAEVGKEEVAFETDLKECISLHQRQSDQREKLRACNTQSYRRGRWERGLLEKRLWSSMARQVDKTIRAIRVFDINLNFSSKNFRIEKV